MKVQINKNINYIDIIHNNKTLIYKTQVYKTQIYRFDMGNIDIYNTYSSPNVNIMYI